MSASVLWMVSTGVDPSHMTNCLPPNNSRKKAIEQMEGLDLRYPLRHAQVTRLQFDSPFGPATRVDVIAKRNAVPVTVAA